METKLVSVLGVLACAVSLLCIPCKASPQDVDDPLENPSESESIVEDYLEALEELKTETELAGDPDPDPRSSARLQVDKVKSQLRTAHVSPEDLKGLLDLDKSVSDNGGRISKRGISRSPSERWPKGIVPFKFTPEIDAKNLALGIRRAHLAWERFTCIRFVQWSNDTEGKTTNDRLGLGHQGHLKHVTSGGCWSSAGNKRSSKGQMISCCGDEACVHELGHALGLHHEQSTSDPNRKLMLRLNRENIGNWAQYRPGDDWSVVGYDFASNMHYHPHGFSINGKPTLTSYFPEMALKIGTTFHYMMMTVSIAHKCAEMNCSQARQTCENDGYLTLVDGKCQCKCVPGLDPDTGCTSIINSGTHTQEWPGGSYALPQIGDECPQDSATRAISRSTGGIKLLRKFCVTEKSNSKDKWPRGNYCILRKGGHCPKEFEHGYTDFGHLWTGSSSSNNGGLPDGRYGPTVRLMFCCRDDGFDFFPIYLPHRKPFRLIKQGKSCQEIRGMHHREESQTIVDKKREMSFGGAAKPFVTTGRDRSTHTITFCSYVPAKIDCGGYHELSRDNPTVTVTSPTGADLDCYWFFKAPEGQHLRLSFDRFNVAGRTGHCNDQLTIQYFRPGQKPYEFCGDHFGRTVQSVNNTILLNLRTHGNSHSEVTATVTLTLDEDLCYNAADKGHSYDGNVNVTRLFRACMPWKEAAICDYNPYLYSPGKTVLDHNYCRNPDVETGMMPWCYVDKDCNRDYCDVCLYGKVFDNKDDCAERAKLGLCTRPETKDVAHVDCAQTCNVPLPSLAQKGTEKHCRDPPERVADGALVGSSRQETYAVGSKVTYKCDTSGMVKPRVCLTSGTWSALGYVCGFCDSPWESHPATRECYLKNDTRMRHTEAVRQCLAQGADMAYPRNAEEDTYLADFIGKDFWIGATDSKVEGTWVDSKGTPLTYTNWGGNQPDDYHNEDCATLRPNGEWNDVHCDAKYKFVCRKPYIEHRLQCKDWLDNCPELFETNPSRCVSKDNFGMGVCPVTCGLCGEHVDEVCVVADPPTNSRVLTNKNVVNVGHVVEYACNEGFLPVAGTAVRGCRTDKTLTGSPLQCIPGCPHGWNYIKATGNCYRYFKDQKNTRDAERNCSSFGAKLAMPKTSEINFELTQLTDWSTLILGLGDKQEEGNFVWADGEPLIGWTNWFRSDPDNYGNEDCVIMRTNSQWQDVQCWYRANYVCELPLKGKKVLDIPIG